MAPTRAEVTLVSLKNCFVNLPPNLIALLSNTNAPLQNVIVELQYQNRTASGTTVKSAYVGWTGMPSRTRPASLLNERSRLGREQDIQTVEIDAAFAKTLGLSEGLKVGVQIHLNPMEVHAVNIEPVTPADWEAIELHANFLELNMLAQIRAIPNPAYRGPTNSQSEHNHALTLHVGPNLTANIMAVTFSPAIPDNIPFAKIAQGAEVIVAPKSRPRSSRSMRGDTRSTVSRRSGRSGTSNRTSASKRPSPAGQSLFLRAVDISVAKEFVSAESDHGFDAGLKMWLSPDIISSEAIKGASFASISVLKPDGLRAQLEQPQIERLKEEDSSEVGRPASRIIARIVPWVDALDSHHVVTSSQLSTMIGVSGLAGLIVRVESAPSPVPRNGLKSLAFFPFLPGNSKKKDGFKFGGDSKIHKQTIIDRLRITHGGDDGLLAGPLTDGMLLPPSGAPGSSSSFDGGILRFRLHEDGEYDVDRAISWALGGEVRQDFEVRGDIPHPMETAELFPSFASGISVQPRHLIGVDAIIKQSMANLTLCSSVLLTGGIGSGKTAVAQWLGRRLMEDYLFNVTFFSCQKLVTDETRVSTIKEVLTRLFMSAAWCARLEGQSVIILDDLDKICPVETELQVGNDNGRSQQVTEILCALVRQYCSIQGGVALLATTQSKDSLNNIVIGGHIAEEIISLKAPTKEIRRDLLTNLLAGDQLSLSGQRPPRPDHSRRPSDSASVTDNSWMNPSDESPRPGSSSSLQIDGFRMAPSLDLLDIAGRTDGYMPADIKLLVSRARNECLIRTVSSGDQDSTALVLTKADFDGALKNFTPTSLRNVTLTHSTTTFSSIGGLKSTRSTLLETLLYPTKYAPIFKASPLRLRSGLLLYGYPGCGKTLLASAVAGECGLNFISVKGPEILNKYIGASEKSVRDLFERAQAAKPCVLFFDEFDSIAPKRGHDSTGVTDRVVNQMLTQMDGAEGLDGVYVLAATSRPDLIDPALLRPGRLDKSLLCDMPDAADREDIIRAVCDKLHLASHVVSRLGEVAAKTVGFSGADLQALMYNAHLEAIHDLLGDQPSGRDEKKTTSSSSLRSAATASMTNGSTSGKSQSSSSSSSSHHHHSHHHHHHYHHGRPSSSSSSRLKKHKSEKDDFIQFLYDPEADAQARHAVGAAGATLEPRAVIAAKLEEMKLARKQEKELVRRQQGRTGRGVAGTDANHDNKQHDGGADTSAAVVVIEWKHVERSLATTRSSISPQERRRLHSIYAEFVSGRNGEMPSGEASKEVGGRSSLM